MAATLSRMSRQVYYASENGAVPDCDLATRAKVGGGTPTDNAPALNAILASASAANPVHLILDGGCAIGAPLVVTDPDHTIIDGLGWGTGLYVLPGSNANAIQNVPHTDIALFNIWNAVGSQVGLANRFTVRNIKIDVNKNSGSSNTMTSVTNCNGHRDGTITSGYAPASSPDARSPYSSGYWLTGITLVGVNNFAMDNVWIYDSPAFHVSLYHCIGARISHCRIEAAVPTFLGNTDGIHLNGGCSDAKISRCWLSTGDDAFAINQDEGDHTAGSDIVVDNCTLSNCVGAGRIFGYAAPTSRVSITNIRGVCQYRGFLVGDEGGNGTNNEANHSLHFANIKLQLTTSSGYGNPSILSFCDSVASCDIVDVESIEPTFAHPVLTFGYNSTHPTLSSMRIRGLGVHRNTFGNAAAYPILGSSGTIGNLSIDGMAITDQSGQSYANVPAMISLTGSAAITRIWAGSLDGRHATAFIDNYTNVGSIAGPGLVASGFGLADPKVGNNSTYYSATQSALAYKDGSGTVNLFNFGTGGGGGGASAGATHAFVTVDSGNGLAQPMQATSVTALQAQGGSFTIGCFVRFTTLSANLHGLVTKWSNAGSPEYGIWYENGSGQLALWTNNGSTNTEILGGTVVAPGVWYFVVGGYDASIGKMFLYLNAVSDATAVTCGQPRSATTAFVIGNLFNPNNVGTNGRIAMAFKYTGALTPTLITWLYNAGSGRSTADILAHAGLTTPDCLYGFDNSSALGTDSGPNGITLTNVNTAPAQGAGPGAAPVLYDLFAGTAGTSITGRTPAPTAHGSDTWKAEGSAASWVIAPSGNGITTPTGGSAWSYQDLTGVTNPDSVVTVVFTATATGNVPQVVIRRHGSSSDTYIIIGFNYGGGVTVGAYIAGVAQSSFGSFSFTWATGTVYTAVITPISSGGSTAVNVAINGTSVGTFTYAQSELQLPGNTEIQNSGSTAGTITVQSFRF